MNRRVTSAVAVYLIFERDEKILIARRCNTGYQDGMYQVPAGHVEMGELPTQAAVREAMEEVGVGLAKPDLEFIHLSARPIHDDTGNRLDIFFRIRKWSGDIRNMEPEKCDELKWVHLAELPENMTPHVKIGIEKGFAGVYSSEITLEEMRRMPLYGLK